MRLTERTVPPARPSRRAHAIRRALQLTALSLLAACAERAAPPLPAAAVVIGQWIWTAADSSRLAQTRRQRPSLRSATWVGTIAVRGESLTVQLGRPLARDAEPGAELVIRIDDGVTDWWKRRDDDSAAQAVGRALHRLLAIADRGTTPHALQLDYDAPVSRLANYATLLQRLRAPGAALEGRELWITSLVAHLADPRFGSRLRPLVDGHIVQLFDTGERHSDAAERALLDRLEAAQLPFRVGLGAFERRLATGTTTHRAWFPFLPRAARSRWYRGAWIFPAGADYIRYLPQ